MHDSMARRASGRRQGEGQKLEEEADRLFREWTYKTERNISVRGLEGDVVGVNPSRFPARIYGQCKDWEEDIIYPSTIYRLIAVSFTLHAHPILIHNTELSKKAERVCKGWGVRCVTTDDLELSHLPMEMPISGNDSCARLPEIVEDTLSPTAQLTPIYDPYHPQYRHCWSLGRHD